MRTVLAVCTLIAATITAYGPALRGGYIWDDNDHLTLNTAVQNPDGPADIWFRLGSTPQYYPLVFTSFWILHCRVQCEVIVDHPAAVAATARSIAEPAAGATRPGLPLSTTGGADPAVDEPTIVGPPKKAR